MLASSSPRNKKEKQTGRGQATSIPFIHLDRTDPECACGTRLGTVVSVKPQNSFVTQQDTREADWRESPNTTSLDKIQGPK